MPKKSAVLAANHNNNNLFVSLSNTDKRCSNTLIMHEKLFMLPTTFQIDKRHDFQSKIYKLEMKIEFLSVAFLKFLKCDV